MTEFKSETKTINTSDSAVFSFLADFNNFEKLMPEQVTNWQSTTDQCSFTIQGMADLAMRIDKKDDPQFISYASEGKSPFSFNLNFSMKALNENQCTVEAAFIADLNPMIKMMASRPLQNFVNLLVDKLKQLMEEGS